MLVREVMTAPAVTVSERATVKEAIGLLDRHDVAVRLAQVAKTYVGSFDHPARPTASASSSRPRPSSRSSSVIVSGGSSLMTFP